MKKIFYIIISSLIMSPFFVYAGIKYDQKLTDRMKGKILLQTEGKGEAWYVNPKDGKRYYMKDGDAALQIMRKFGLGIKTSDLEKIEPGVVENAPAKKVEAKVEAEAPKKENKLILKETYQEINLNTIAYLVAMTSEKKYINGVLGSRVADAGKKFVVVTMKVTNITNSSFDFDSDYAEAFPVVDKDGNKYEPMLLQVGLVSDYLSMRKLTPGKPEYGNVVYEIPENVDQYYIASCKSTDECYVVKISPTL